MPVTLARNFQYHSGYNYKWHTRGGVIPRISSHPSRHSTASRQGCVDMKSAALTFVLLLLNSLEPGQQANTVSATDLWSSYFPIKLTDNQTRHEPASSTNSSSPMDSLKTTLLSDLQNRKVFDDSFASNQHLIRNILLVGGGVTPLVALQVLSGALKFSSKTFALAARLRPFKLILL